MYLNNDYISNGAGIIHRRGSTVDQIVMFSENYNPEVALDMEKMYNMEVLDICTSGAYMGMWQILAVANILKHPIHSVYPDVRQIVRPDLNRKVFCYDDILNSKTLLHIMWTPMAVNSDDPCHFVPLLKVVRETIDKNTVIYELLQILQNFLKFYICRPVKLPAVMKQLDKKKETAGKQQQTSQQTQEEPTESNEATNPAGGGGGSGATRGRGYR